MIVNKKYFCMSLLLSLVTLVLDQITKRWLLETMEFSTRSLIEITSFFNLVLVWNHGISFGILSGQRVPLLLIILALAVIIVLFSWLARANDRFITIGVGLVIGGAAGNVIDRVRFGAVVDFLDFHLMGLHWPAFNVADSSIFIGVVVLCIQSILSTPKKTL